ncbi:guanine deaminase [Pseudomassariella vexata]|uniref:Probable guanine deaminase n=1 Tax=Pseudomassariella vexata TaxID=1141098 RepID=A0A1Y2E0W8_9PEZI|nr:guanine deaminase [Pseudomassariella vexata]ORY65188.1 guanine deaminase [Pseudomassariella vexata]
MASNSGNAKKQAFVGTFVHSKKLDELEYLHDTVVCVDPSGKIVAVERECDAKKAEQILFAKLGWDAADVQVHVCKEGQFFFPGFIDTHIHASQYPNVGIFGKSTLLDWLNTYTFPMEASLSSLSKARRVYTRCIRRTLAHGTTTAAYYATISVPSTSLLADLCLSLGQRAFVGRVCMDRLGPSYYLDESPEAALSATKASIEHIRSIDPNYDLITPILTPRFAPSCTADTMKRLGALQAETGLPVQTHISENVNEITLVRDLFPDSEHYAGVYDDCGLLTPKTILSHAIHLSEDEAELITARGSKVAHCPCSNSAITSGEARVRWLLDKGIGVGLGTDMSGGYSPSILEAARLACLVSRHLAMGDGKGGAADAATMMVQQVSAEERERAKLSVEEVLYLATKGGAAVVGLEGKVGGFEVGMEWDAQLVGLGVVGEVAEGKGVDQVEGEDEGNVDLFGWESWEDRVAKWLFNGDDRNTKRVWVRGRLVHSRV